MGLLLSCCAASSLNAATGRQDNPPETIDFSSAEPEQVIEPTATCELPADEFPDQVIVDGERHVAYAATEYVAINLFSVAATVWIEAVAFVLAGLLLVLLRRTWRRPQSPGSAYCRRCNYELTNLAGSVCPECGSDVSGRGRMRGRRRWPRAMATALLLLAVIAGYALGFRRVPRLIWPQHWPAWWSSRMDRVAEANSKYPWLIQHSRVLSRLVQIDLASGSAHTIATGHHPEADHINALFLSDDGGRLTVWRAGRIETRSAPDWHVEASIDLPHLLDRHRLLSVIEVLADRDGAELLVLARALGSGNRADSPCAGMLIDALSGEVIWQLEDFAGQSLTSLRAVHSGDFDRFILAGDLPATGQTALSEWYVSGGQPVRMRHFDTAAYVLGPRLARSGFGHLIWASNMDSLEAWNLQTERIEKRITLPAATSLLTAWPGQTPRLIVTMLDKETTVWIINPEAGRVLARLAEAPSRTRGVQVLGDGQTLALWGYDDNLGDKVVLLFDVSSVAGSGGAGDASR